MFAVIKTGGKQYKVAEGDELVVEKLDAEAGKSVTFSDVLMLGDGKTVTVGAPLVAGASVTAEIAEQRRGKKVLIRKKRQRSTYRRTQGHRQYETVVTITAINASGKKKTAAPKKAAAPRKEASPKASATAKPETDARGRLTQAVGKADDLKKISGVGPVLEKKLNEAGIFHFWQVGALKKAQIEELEEEMSFPGRITRDEWVRQAKEFAKDA